jgi:hypothetical protein
VLAFFIYTRCKRRREQDLVAIAPSASTHWLDEKDDRGFLGPTERSFSPIHFAGRISPIQFAKTRGHNRLNSELSLESHTEPFRPTSLAQPPYVEPFQLPDGDFVEYRNSNLNPTHPPATLQRQSSYDDRLAAASASLPVWRTSTAHSDASRYPSTVYQKPIEADRLSTYSALYEGLIDDDASSDDHSLDEKMGREKYRSS